MDEGKFSFLADNQELNVDLTDFSDSASLMRRHKKIMENI
jgi:hypothetical protein